MILLSLAKDLTARVYFQPTATSSGSELRGLRVKVAPAMEE